jgi:SAM-dependent methyltransferase
MIKELATNNPFLVRLYQWLIGYNAGAGHWCRIEMDKATNEIVRKLEFKALKTLEISGDKWRSFGFKSYESVFFPAYDICKQPLDRQYDLIIAEQVFEHLLWPYRAGRNVIDMMNPGGYFLITTPFLIKIHNYPIDCSRWTPLGIKYFLAECGFDLESIQVYSWGNRKCVTSNFDEWMPYNPKKHTLQNEEDFPLVVWALARKKT